MSEQKNFKLRILKINETLFDGDIEKVVLPGVGGEMTVLVGHEPLVSLLKEGKIVVTPKEGEKQDFDIDRGYFEITQLQVSVLLS